MLKAMEKLARGQHESIPKDGPQTNGLSATVKEFRIHSQGGLIPCETRGDTRTKFIFTHGAVGGLETSEMIDFANGFSNNLQIVSFHGSNTSVQSRLKSFETVINQESNVSAIGGRSMGSRAAALTVTHALSANNDPSWAKQLVLVSFPLIGKRSGESRASVLLELPAEVEVLFVSGDQDSMCNLEQLSQIRQQMRAHSWLLEVSGASHTMKFHQGDGIIGKAMRAESGRLASEWLLKRDRARTTRLVYWNERLAQIEVSGWK